MWKKQKRLKPLHKYKNGKGKWTAGISVGQLRDGGERLGGTKTQKEHPRGKAPIKDSVLRYIAIRKEEKIMNTATSAPKSRIETIRRRPEKQKNVMSTLFHRKQIDPSR